MSISRLLAVVAGISLVLLVNCHKAPILLSQAIVRNASSQPISNVQVQHEPTGGVGRVNRILPEAELDLGFVRQPMKAKWAIVNWKISTGETRQARVDLPRRTGATDGQTFSLIYTIDAGGSVSARLIPG